MNITARYPAEHVRAYICFSYIWVDRIFVHSCLRSCLFEISLTLVRRSRNATGNQILVELVHPVNCLRLFVIVILYSFVKQKCQQRDKFMLHLKRTSIINILIFEIWVITSFNTCKFYFIQCTMSRNCCFEKKQYLFSAVDSIHGIRTRRKKRNYFSWPAFVSNNPKQNQIVTTQLPFDLLGNSNTSLPPLPSACSAYVQIVLVG